MDIQCLGNIGIVTTKLKPYWYKRKGYYVGERWVKPKKIRKYRTVIIKEPYLHGNIVLHVYADLKLGGVYADENGKQYICCLVQRAFQKPVSMLKICSLNLGKTFSPPTTLTLAMQAIGEYSNATKINI